MIELNVAQHLARLRGVTPDLLHEFRLPALLSFSDAKPADVAAQTWREWEDEQNAETYRLLCLRSLRYATVRDTFAKRALDFEPWWRAYTMSEEIAFRQECILACYGSGDDRAWELVRVAANDRASKLRAVALHVAGSIVRGVPARRAAGMALLTYNLEHGNPWHRLGALMGYSIAGLRGAGLVGLLTRFIAAEWDESLRHVAIGFLARVADKEAFAAFAADFAQRAAPLPPATEAVLFQFLSEVHPAKAQAITAQAITNPKAAGSLAGAAAQGLAAQATLGAQAWNRSFQQMGPRKR